MIKKITDDISLVIIPLEDSKKVYMRITTWGHKTDKEGIKSDCSFEQSLTVDIETASWIEDALNTSIQEINRRGDNEKRIKELEHKIKEKNKELEKLMEEK
tara:strand:- start:1 stop:303 length:303 start_codon:yes stop_codon:yes gene_type:complete